MPKTTASPEKTEKGPLTRQQRRILGFIVDYWAKHMAPPSLREICAHFGIVSPNGVVCHLNALKKKGWIRYTPGDLGSRQKSRSIIVPELLEAAKTAAAAYWKSVNTKAKESVHE